MEKNSVTFPLDIKTDFHQEASTAAWVSATSLHSFILQATKEKIDRLYEASPEKKKLAQEELQKRRG